MPDRVNWGSEDGERESEVEEFHVAVAADHDVGGVLHRDERCCVRGRRRGRRAPVECT